MDFTQADRANSTLLNQILWRERMGSRRMPPPQEHLFRVSKPGDTNEDH